jgi:hypothetical protein
MKFVLFLSAALLAISECVFCQPKVHLPEGKLLYFDDVLNFTPKKRSMTIKNSGTDTLILSNVGASCGCTALLLSDDRIPPNDSASLLITLDARRFSGKVEKLISFNTNDKAEPLVEVKFIANVISILQIEPEYIFIRTSIGSPVNQELKISNLSDKRITFLSVRSSLENLSVSLSETELTPHGEITLSITFNPKVRGTLSGNITIATDHPQLGTFSVRFHCWTK